MDRLTFDGNFCDIAQCCELPCRHGGSCSQRKVWERLKQYEDTGLTPAECTHLKNTYDEDNEELDMWKARAEAAVNELCQSCGKYTRAYDGACDECRWKGGAGDGRA